MNNQSLSGEALFGATVPGAGVAAATGFPSSQVDFSAFTEHAAARGRLAFQATTPAADGHSRERSHFTAAGRPRRELQSDASVQQLLMEQNRLLMQQVQALQSQMAQSHQQNVVPASCDVPNRKYLDPRQCLEGVDPALKLVFEEFGKECKHLFAAWETQKALHEKYAKLTADGKIHKHFESEASFKWQFTKLYIAQAQPVQGEEGMADDHYDLLAAWEAMRERHAKECFSFICLHQKQCLDIYESEIAHAKLQQKLEDKLHAWFAQHAYDDAGVQQTMLSKAGLFVDSLIRLERPAIQARMDKEKELRQKREQSLLDARSKWESMDVKDVLSPALFELAKLSGGKHKPITLKDDSALAFLVQSNEELMEKHKVKIVGESSSKPSASSSKVRAPTPKRLPKKQARPGSKSQSSRGRSNSASRGGSRRSSKSSAHSSSRAATPRRVRFADDKDGKGKGKKKGKGKGKPKRK